MIPLAVFLALLILPNVSNAFSYPSGVVTYTNLTQSVDLADRSVIADGNTYDYGRIVIDTGSTSDHSKVPGHEKLYGEFGDFHTNTQAAHQMYKKVSAFTCLYCRL